MAKNNFIITRRENLKKIGFLYKRKFGWVNWCVYCGLKAQARDHVLPLTRAVLINFDHPAAKRAVGQGLNTVPCCHECNNIAEDEFFTNIRDKRVFIQKKLKKKYRKYLKTVLWDEEELREVSYTMRQDIEKMLHNRMIVERRILFPAVVGTWHKRHKTKRHLL